MMYLLRGGSSASLPCHNYWANEETAGTWDSRHGNSEWLEWCNTEEDTVADQESTEDAPVFWTACDMILLCTLSPYAAIYMFSFIAIGLIGRGTSATTRRMILLPILLMTMTTMMVIVVVVVVVVVKVLVMMVTVIVVVVEAMLHPHPLPVLRPFLPSPHSAVLTEWQPHPLTVPWANLHLNPYLDLVVWFLPLHLRLWPTHAHFQGLQWVPLHPNHSP